PGRPIGDGMDGHSWWPLFENIPTEYLEAYYPLRVDGYTPVTDSGGPGFHRGGNGVEHRYGYLEPGPDSVRHARRPQPPRGRAGGRAGGGAGRAFQEGAGAGGGGRDRAAGQVGRDRGGARRHGDLPDGRGRRLERPPRPAGGGGRARCGVRAGLAREGAFGV